MLRRTPPSAAARAPHEQSTSHFRFLVLSSILSAVATAKLQAEAPAKADSQFLLLPCGYVKEPGWHESTRRPLNNLLPFPFPLFAFAICAFAGQQFLYYTHNPACQAAPSH